MASSAAPRGFEAAGTSLRCESGSAVVRSRSRSGALRFGSVSVSRSPSLRSLATPQRPRAPGAPAGRESPLASSSGRRLRRGWTSEGSRPERSRRPRERSLGFLKSGPPPLPADLQLPPPRSPRPVPASVARISARTEYTQTPVERYDVEATLDEAEADLLLGPGGVPFRNHEVLPAPTAQKQRQRERPSRRPSTDTGIPDRTSRSSPGTSSSAPMHSNGIELWSSGAGSLRHHQSHSPSAGRRLWGDLTEVFVILFGAGEEGNEGIYSLRALSREDGLPKDTIIAFEDQADAERYASQLTGTFRTFSHLPNVCSIPPEELLDFCVEAGYNCRLEPCGTRLMPPNFNVGTTDWERSLRLRSGQFSVLDQEPDLSQDSSELADFGLSELDRMKLQLERLIMEDIPEE